MQEKSGPGWKGGELAVLQNLPKFAACCWRVTGQVSQEGLSDAVRREPLQQHQLLGSGRKSCVQHELEPRGRI